jgi:hypothetical protein
MKNIAADTVVTAKESTTVPSFGRGSTGNKRLRSKAKFQRMLIARYRVSSQLGTYYFTEIFGGRAIVQAVSRRLPTAAARVRAQVKSCGICDGQSGPGAGFLQVLRFPLPVLIPPTNCSTIIIVVIINIISYHPELVQ